MWNMTYGRNDGIMWNNCTRESQNSIFCRSENILETLSGIIDLIFGSVQRRERNNGF